MVLKYVKLENIRSYINQKIEFPTGSILLSGDIGAGKSTVLLSIEFALFGIKKNIYRVELYYDMGNKKVLLN